MFAQAGFNPRRTFVCYAYIMRPEWFPRFRPSRLVRFASGEYAWDGGHGRISWPEQVRYIGCFRGLLPDRLGALEYSELPGED